MWHGSGPLPTEYGIDPLPTEYGVALFRRSASDCLPLKEKQKAARAAMWRALPLTRRRRDAERLANLYRQRYNACQRDVRQATKTSRKAARRAGKGSKGGETPSFDPSVPGSAGEAAPVFDVKAIDASTSGGVPTGVWVVGGLAAALFVAALLAGGRGRGAVQPQGSVGPRVYVQPRGTRRVAR